MRTGDHVYHRPSGEEWIVACVRGDRLSWCGWPEGQAEVADCELIAACTDAEHWSLVEKIARVTGSDHRGVYCRWLLAQRAQEEPTP